MALSEDAIAIIKAAKVGGIGAIGCVALRIGVQLDRLGFACLDGHGADLLAAVAFGERCIEVLGRLGGQAGQRLLPDS